MRIRGKDGQQGNGNRNRAGEVGKGKRKNLRGMLRRAGVRGGLAGGGKKGKERGVVRRGKRRGGEALEDA